ncbi:hypothetical protein DO97_13570 [Neosynechococcus sphagnicola sy1]|uniref:Protein kinase domain-containing protein n=1 Tax=Neosynechococcus sphagnicola sy1 TaxID=1497020 RepID=A0A098TMH7_9CYAN|nr:serine/threonine-protein kinase [Neosynechococcus sphagnicola]KGF72043.1 hypothetical protein DO97_13570 [Neosynechococcus sphagnicola sy1]
MTKLLVAGSKRSKYRLLGLVGQGQFGKVYCASHRQTGKIVAMKSLDRHRFPTHKFLRELRFLLSLQHENIVSCQSLEHTATGRYLVMDYCEGGNLRSLIDGQSSLTLTQGLQLVIDVLAGLDHAHRQGIIHCDIKPENILLSVQPTGWRARISDFGIARLVQEMYEDGFSNNTGSPAYMAPERFYGQYFPASDLYAVGVMLFELLVGVRPFSGTPEELMSAHLNRPVQIPASVPPSLQTVIVTALRKLPARRFPDAAAMLKALQTAISSGLESGLASTPLPLEPLEDPAEMGFDPPRAIAPFVSLQQQPLQQPIHQLATQVTPRNGTGVTWVASGTLVAIHRADLTELPNRNAISLPETVQQLRVCTQGCLAVTQRGIYGVFLEPAVPDGNPASGTTPDVARLLLPLATAFQVGLAPSGNWMATVTSHQGIGKLTIWDGLFEIGSWGKIPRQRVSVSCQATQPTHLLVLDAHHLAVLSDLRAGSSLQPPGASDAETDLLDHRFAVAPRVPATGLAGTLIEIYTRRGNCLGSWVLPIYLEQVLLGNRPYQILAKERHTTHSVLLIDLKPLRIQRLCLTIQPILMTSMVWGYALADTAGQLMLLDLRGQPVAQVQAPKPNITAIALTGLNPYTLLLSTWGKAQGMLYQIDLRQLEIDFLF